ncbi:type II toxin-antitoxin system RelE/ParE family toxin [Proteus mirabilis]|uniref:type II toxin-antitoxin system RelE/ParE family toxin n=1 Tax=Proteus TaxID=583 RepID=UPI00073C2153|nr:MULTISPECIES: type II toxin-antitoxin system RelE/ParE family toxin [Proteus]EKT9735121.1 type II toxin-antitoxin system RelE/ParE family toxin [Proteus mirabilis]EKV9969717.1 type II toxin-antitoxin system RelE/ParE family toxin [Proteus mirabilis]EKW6743726.1 type II toxin-antitoxin system RelE/ParE family toxin [Proteus mirabilis]ELA6763165.1 type II toxin-antitoxin system RelE/ParE family toxin [Proteus mirabilis]EMA1122835.1 type II toxin-antitoxin system RelE/ParE family toxin [Proteu
MASYKVVMTKDAETDLENIYNYIADHDSIDNADYVLDELLKITNTLANFPMKGSIPKELQSLGIREYQQIFFKPYRVIYHTIAKQVVIFIIADGRRDMQALLTRRLLG